MDGETVQAPRKMSVDGPVVVNSNTNIHTHHTLPQGPGGELPLGILGYTHLTLHTHTPMGTSKPVPPGRVKNNEEGAYPSTRD